MGPVVAPFRPAQSLGIGPEPSVSMVVLPLRERRELVVGRSALIEQRSASLSVRDVWGAFAQFGRRWCHTAVSSVPSEWPQKVACVCRGHEADLVLEGEQPVVNGARNPSLALHKGRAEGQCIRQPEVAKCVWLLPVGIKVKEGCAVDRQIILVPIEDAPIEWFLLGLKMTAAPRDGRQRGRQWHCGS